MNSWMWKKPQDFDHRDKAQLRWFHFSLVGRLTNCKGVYSQVMSSPSTSQEAKDLAKQIDVLHEQLRIAMTDRENC